MLRSGALISIKLNVFVLTVKSFFVSVFFTFGPILNTIISTFAFIRQRLLSQHTIIQQTVLNHYIILLLSPLQIPHTVITFYVHYMRLVRFVYYRWNEQQKGVCVFDSYMLILKRNIIMTTNAK